jgi:hypothetical protein
MNRIDPFQERKRLAEFYGGRLDGELEQIAGEAWELTDAAKDALRAELERRGLSPKLTDVPSYDALELRRMVTVRQFRDLPEALLAKGSLDSAGIESHLVDDNTVRLDWFWSNLLGGVKLQVNAEDVGPANEILDQPIPAEFDASGSGPYQQPRCPRCQSLEVSYEDLRKPIAYVTASLGVPIPWHHRAWRCHACQAQWEDTGSDEPSSSAP